MNQPNHLIVYTPAQFGALCGKSTSYGYRRIYDGSIQVLQDSPRLLIPESEVIAFFSRKGPHTRRQRLNRPKKTDEPTLRPEPKSDLDGGEILPPPPSPPSEVRPTDDSSTAVENDNPGEPNNH